jgi:hypothetical protein
MKDRDIDSALAQLRLDIISIEEIEFLVSVSKPMDLIVASFWSQFRNIIARSIVWSLSCLL